MDLSRKRQCSLIVLFVGALDGRGNPMQIPDQQGSSWLVFLVVCFCFTIDSECLEGETYLFDVRAVANKRQFSFALF